VTRYGLAHNEHLREATIVIAAVLESHGIDRGEADALDPTITDAGCLTLVKSLHRVCADPEEAVMRRTESANVAVAVTVLVVIVITFIGLFLLTTPPRSRST